MENKIVNCNGIEISNKNKICLIAGPCQLETEQHAMDMSGKIKEIASKLGIDFIYNTSDFNNIPDYGEFLWGFKGFSKYCNIYWCSSFSS